MRQSYCKNCGSPIVWKRAANSKNTPCNPKMVNYRPSSYGKDRIVTTEGELINADIIKESNGLIGYVDHRTTCKAIKTR